MNLRFLCLFVILNLCAESANSQKPHSNQISIAANYTTITYDSRNLDFKFGKRCSYHRRFDIKNIHIYVGLEYVQKGANWSFYTMDTIHRETKLYQNKDFLNLHYIGVPIGTSLQLFKTRFYFGFNFNINYLVSGKKYDYRYNMINKSLTISKNEITSNSEKPFEDDKIKRVESALGITVKYKPKCIPQTYISLGFEKGLSSIFTLRNFRNNQLYLSYSYLF